MNTKNDPLRDRYVTILRNVRQAGIAEWVRRTFGSATMTLEERAMRFAEEAIELAQAAGLTEERVRAIVAHVYKKPAGEIGSEVGGVGITLLALAAVADVSADKEEVRELYRVLAIPRDYFQKRHNAKAEAGIAVPTSNE